MARIDDDMHAGGRALDPGQHTILTADGGTVGVPSDDFITHADIARDGYDLVLTTADGHSLIIQNYFSTEPHPALHSPSGAMLDADMIHSFVHDAGPVQFTDNATASDASPVGVAREIHGHATIKHPDGTTETMAVGTPIHEGDVIETDAQGAVNITFRDNSSFAVSQNAKLAIDEYVFDPHSDAGTSNFSMLRGLFVYTSGLIGHQDPDDVHIHTPVGSIGIRGTVIAGNIDTGQITVVEGAIVLQSNSGETSTLSSQYQTAQFNPQNGHITAQGNLSAGDVAARFSAVSDVAPAFFSSLGTAPAESGAHDSTAPSHDAGHGGTTTPSTAPAGDSHGAQEAPTTITTAQAQTFGNEANTFSSADTFSAAASSSGTSATGSSLSSTAPAATVSAPPPAPSAPSASSPSAADASTPIVGTTAPPPTGSTPPPVDHAPTGALVLNLNALFSAPSALGFTITDNNNEGFGSSIAAVGDLNNDGIGDLALVKDNTAVAGGGLYFEVMGSTTAHGNLFTTGGLAIPNQPAGFSGYDSNMQVASVGDFNGDGHGDFIVSAPNSDNGATHSGNAIIVSGAGGILETLTGMTAGEHFGWSVAGIGDVNGDGYADALVSAGGTGADYILYGSGITSPQAEDLNAGSHHQIITGLGDSMVGSVVSGAGDFNNDGHADFMVSYSLGGAQQVNLYDGGNSAPVTLGSPIVIDGFASGSTLQLMNFGNLDASGGSDIGVLSMVDNRVYGFLGHTGISGPLHAGSADFTIASAGTIMAAGAVGDFNGDGYADIGVITHAGGNADIYVVYGGSNLSGGLAINDAYLNDPTHAFHMTYTPAAADLVGMTIGSAGDLNGDGFGDLVIGVPGLDTNADTSADGGAIVVYGQAAGMGSYIPGATTATNANQSLVGTAGADALSDGNQSGVSFSAGAGDDLITLHNSAFRSIDGGSGLHDVIQTDANLDFSAVAAGSIRHIEEVDMTSSAFQNITLSINSIFQLMESSDNGTLTIADPGGATTFNNTLAIGGTGVTSGNTLSVSAVQTATGAGNAVLTGGFDVFHIGSHTLNIQDSLFAHNNVVAV